MKVLFNVFESLWEPAAMLAALVFFMFLNDWVFKKFKRIQNPRNVLKRSIAAFIILFGLVGFVLTLPVDKTTKEQILGFLGIIISAGIALSSTTVLGNIMAGIMNNSMKRFRNGDLVKIDNLRGRVTKKDMFHIEVQLEDSNTLTIPNLYIATKPVKLTRKSDTVIYSEVSLGYDVPRRQVEATLKEAAQATGLKDPYVYITKLGDFSVNYKVHGFLEDTSKYFSSISELNGQVMDKLHQAGIEIVSPGFVYQRRVEGQVVIPEPERETESQKQERSPEELIFDKAIEAEKIEEKKEFLKKLDKQADETEEKIKQTESDDEKNRLKTLLKNIEKRKKQISENIEKQKKANEEN